MALSAGQRTTPGTEQEPANNKSGLLSQLKIPREPPEVPKALSRRFLAGGAVVLGLVVAFGLAGTLWLRSRSTPAHATPPPAVAQEPAPSPRSGPSAILQATGYVTARRQATVSAQITGALTEVRIEEGEHVTAGQVLAHLDSTAQKAALAQEEAQYGAAQALLGQFDAQLTQARRDCQRAQDLVAQHLVSQQSVETARTEVDKLAAQLESQRHQVELMRARVRGARVQLDYTVLRAPFAGVVVAKTAQPGEIVSPVSAGGGFTRTGVGTIVDMDSLEIEVDVNEAYINRVTPQQSARATLEAYPDWDIPAHVIAIIPTADRSKATVKVRIGIDQKDPRVFPDMGVRVSFLEAPAARLASGTPVAASKQQ